MTIQTILGELNPEQRAAATAPRQHALVLAGAGAGKTKTIVARAAYLIHQGVPAHRIQILTFTRRSASEIVERVKMHLGDAAARLHASTFHTWCMSILRRAPEVFGAKDHSVIDRDDQIHLFKVVRGKGKDINLPTAAQLADLYSYARNTGQTLDATLQELARDQYHLKDDIARVMQTYEARKRERRYLDYDDIIDVVATRINTTPEVRDWLASQLDYLLVDEMQDTNPLQWKLLSPLKDSIPLFCVGDDAQSIYGFRGADFRNVHSFGERVPGSTTLRLDRNYRSTQEILDLSNWLLDQSPLEYKKRLVANRGAGVKPAIHHFGSDFEEARWIADDLQARHGLGAPWNDHMILARSSFAARVIEGALLAADIPYTFIGGTKLMESAHVRDVMAALRLVANHRDELAAIRYFTLFDGIGEARANRLIDKIAAADSIDSAIAVLEADQKLPRPLSGILRNIRPRATQVGAAFEVALAGLAEILEAKYRNQEWEKRKRDFRLVQRLAEKHSSILAFIEDYLLDPVHGTEVDNSEQDDVVTVITIHSAKGTERKVCYVINVTPGAYPSKFAAGDDEKVEEERRVLYVALTRAMDELILTKLANTSWAFEDDGTGAETYFLNDLPEHLVTEHHHRRPVVSAEATRRPADIPAFELPGISIG